MPTRAYRKKRRALKLKIKELSRTRLGYVLLVKDPIVGYANRLTLAQIVGIYPLFPPGHPKEHTLFVKVYFPLTNNTAKLSLEQLRPVTVRKPVDLRAWNMGKVTTYPGFCTQLEMRL